MNLLKNVSFPEPDTLFAHVYVFSFYSVTPLCPYYVYMFQSYNCKPMGRASDSMMAPT